MARCLKEPWANCQGLCLVESKKFGTRKKCPMPEYTLYPDLMVMMCMQGLEFPVFHIEIHGQKETRSDVSKLQVEGCWSLAFMPTTYAMEVEKTSVNLLKMEKNRKTRSIVTLSDTVSIGSFCPMNSWYMTLARGTLKKVQLYR